MPQNCHHRTSVVSVFDVWATYDRNWRKPHYPSYEVVTRKVGSALDLEGAQRIVREAGREDRERERPDRPKILSLHVREMPLGQLAREWDALSERVYDPEGVLLDQRTIPTEGAIFRGRTPGEIRLREGDLCEVLDGERVCLGIVAATPPSREEAQRINAGPFHLEAGDDNYVVLTSAGGITHDHADSLHVFSPRFRIAPRTAARLRKAYGEFASEPERLSRADSAAAEQLRALTGELGWEMDLALPRWKGDTFKLLLRGVPLHPDGLDLQVAQWKAHHHMDRLRNAFLRLAGRPAEGWGYRLKRVPVPEHVRGLAVQDPPPMYYF